MQALETQCNQEDPRLEKCKKKVASLIGACSWHHKETKGEENEVYQDNYGKIKSCCNRLVKHGWSKSVGLPLATKIMNDQFDIAGSKTFELDKFFLFPTEHSVVKALGEFEKS